MKIYTANPDNRKKYEICKLHELGIMLTPRHRLRFSPALHEFPIAVDNGAFRAYTNKSLWDEYAFLKLVSRVVDAGITPDFIVLPDIVGGGSNSLFRSLRWTERLEGAIPLALAVQDGMERVQVESYLDRFQILFVGGTERWKWDTAPLWIQAGREWGKLVHIGRAGTLEKLSYAAELGADSVDSSSLVRNGTWIVLDRFRKNEQLNIFNRAAGAEEEKPNADQ